MIITKTPFRMSFFGGGTDMPSFFRENGGSVLSTTFDKSWMIGDGENDVLAGKNAGCKTVLIGNQDYQQDYTVSSLKEFVDRVL